MHGDGFTEATHSAGFDINDAAGPQLDGSPRAACVMNGLIQADGSLDLLLKLGVKVEVVVPKGLLDHQQLELIELLEMLNVIESVRGVRVAAEQYLWPALANALKYSKIPSGLALQLDALVAGGEFCGDLLH